MVPAPCSAQIDVVPSCALGLLCATGLSLSLRPHSPGQAAAALARQGLLCPPRHHGPWTSLCSALWSQKQRLSLLCCCTETHTLPSQCVAEMPCGMQDTSFALAAPCVSPSVGLNRSRGAGPGKPALCRPAVLSSQGAGPSRYRVTAVISEGTVGFLTERSGRGRSQHLVQLGLPRMLAHFQLCM